MGVQTGNVWGTHPDANSFVTQAKMEAIEDAIDANATASASAATAAGNAQTTADAAGAAAASKLDSVVGGDNITIDNTDPQNPIISATGGATGDMAASVYDPTNVNGDAFDMDNMVEGTAKILTTAERANIAAAVSHAANTSNPHGVTKSQVGLGNVDNTSDANKPVSTAQQAALNLKANTSALGTAASQPSTAFATAAQGTKADSALQSVVAGTNVSVDNTDPQNPVVSASGGGGSSVNLEMFGDTVGPNYSETVNAAYYPASMSLGTQSGQALLVPWKVGSAVKLRSVALQVTTAGDSGCLIYIGLYKASGDHGNIPDTLVVDLGSVAGDAVSNGVRSTPGTPVDVEPGVHGFIITTDATSSYPGLKGTAVLTDGFGWAGSASGRLDLFLRVARGVAPRTDFNTGTMPSYLNWTTGSGGTGTPKLTQDINQAAPTILLDLIPAS